MAFQENYGHEPISKYNSKFRHIVQLFEKKTVTLERHSNCGLFWEALVQISPDL
jgi:hypothetical protein